MLSSAIGVVGGLGGIAFQVTEQSVFRVCLQGVAGFSPKEAAGERRLFAEPEREFNPWLLLAVMTSGGLISGWLVQRFAPEAEGHGTDAAIEAFHHKRGHIRPVVPIIKLIASAVTIGTGGSAGREGPIAQIGAGFGSLVGAWFGLSARDRRILLAAGMAAGIGAIFRAPLAAALFAAEIMYREADIETDVIVPAAISSIVGYTVFAFWLPPDIRFQPLFGDSLRHQLYSLVELGPLSLMAVALVAMGVIYIKCYYGLHRWFKRCWIPRIFRPVLGAALAGAAGLSLYFMFGRDARVLAVLSAGYGTLQEALSDPRKAGGSLLLVVALGKIATTSLTIGSGGSGGVFGPSMVIGGCTGGAIGTLFHRWWPSLCPNPAIYTVVGMAGFFAGCARAPISTIVMVTELTGDYSLLVPAMWVSTLCFILGNRWTLYEKQLPSRLDSPAHRGDFLVDVLEGIAVGDVAWKQVNTVHQSETLPDIVHGMAQHRQHYFPVVDDSRRMIGIFSADDVRPYLFDQSLWKLVVASDLMTSRVVAVTPVDDLNTALRRFTELNLDELPVVAENDPKNLLGMLRRKDVIARYNQSLFDHKKSLQDES
ncbi:MAG: chloride channel protein [Pirellulales bacterium]